MKLLAGIKNIKHDIDKRIEESLNAVKLDKQHWNK